MIGLLAAALTLLTSTFAFSPDQCNATTYGRPDRAACQNLLTVITKSGVGNTSYLFIPSQYSTPDGISNDTRRNFPVSWSTGEFSAAVCWRIREWQQSNDLSFGTVGCNASLVPIEEDISTDANDTIVTYDTSTVTALATVGGDIITECISNKTRASGGWELAGIYFLSSYPNPSSLFVQRVFSGLTQYLCVCVCVCAGDNEALVLHLYAPGSEIEKTIKAQTSVQIAATNEEEIEDAELSDPVYQDFADDFGDGINNFTSSAGNDSTTTGDDGTSTTADGTTTGGEAQPVSSDPPNIQNVPQAVPSAGTFSYTGCSVDSASSRTLSSVPWKGDGLTVQRCATYCAQYQYMGVEFGSEYVIPLPLYYAYFLHFLLLLLLRITVKRKNFGFWID